MRKRKSKQLVWLHSHFLYWMGGTKYIFEVIQQLKKKNPRQKIVVIVEDASELAQQQYKKIKVPLVSLHSTTSTHPLYWLFLPFFLWQNTQKNKKDSSKEKIRPRLNRHYLKYVSYECDSPVTAVTSSSAML